MKQEDPKSIILIKILDYFYFKEHLFIVTELLKVFLLNFSIIYTNVNNKELDILIFRDWKEYLNKY